MTPHAIFLILGRAKVAPINYNSNPSYYFSVNYIYISRSSISTITVGIFISKNFQGVSLSLAHTSGLTLTVSLDSNITLDSYKDYTIPTIQQCMLLGLKDNVGTFGYVRSAQQCHFYQLTKVQMRRHLQPQNGMDVFSVFFEVSVLCNVFGSFHVCLNLGPCNHELSDGCKCRKYFFSEWLASHSSFLVYSDNIRTEHLCDWRSTSKEQTR